jgi:hypothetical protein
MQSIYHGTFCTPGNPVMRKISQVEHARSRELLEVLNGENYSPEYQNRHSGNRNVKERPFFRGGLFLLFLFQLFVKTFEHSWINLAGIILLTNPEWKGSNWWHRLQPVGPPYGVTGCATLTVLVLSDSSRERI